MLIDTTKGPIDEELLEKSESQGETETLIEYRLNGEIVRTIHVEFPND
jgi:hypothetical protein